jgi:N-hydroxyarylamine O-acetyltransferase
MAVRSPVPDTLRDAVLRRLGVARPESPDLAGLARIYAAWCELVPFDNVLKMVHLAEGRPGPLPGSTAVDFFTSWLETGAGGTCWAGNGALHDLLATLGYEVERAAATMLVTPDVPPSNHGSVVVTIGNERYVVDASILMGAPLRLPRPGEPPEPAADAVPRIERRGEMYVIMWRHPKNPAGFPCRFDRIGLDTPEWDALHQRTGIWSPFNYAVSARANRGPNVIGFVTGHRFAIDAIGTFSEEPRERAGRDRFLVEELGLDSSLVALLPDDRELPPAPEGFPARPAEIGR